MVVYLWLLSLLLIPATASAEAGFKIRNHCLDCHPVHYQKVAGCSDCHRGMSGTARIEIAHSGLIAARYAAFTLAKSPLLQRGEKRLKEYACRRCHISDKTGNRLAANLDLVLDHATPEKLDAAIKAPVLFMPDFRFSESQRIELVNAILAGAKRAGNPAGEQPLQIHFESETGQSERQFEKHCGGCHRALTLTYGGLGNGLEGPNLSGLFSEFYPQNYSAENQRWDPEKLEKWIKNPRKIRPLAQMAPLELQPAELDKLKEELHLAPTTSRTAQ